MEELIENITKQFNEEAAQKKKNSSPGKQAGPEKSPEAKTDEKDTPGEVSQFEGGSQNNIDNLHLLISKIENSVLLIRNSKNLAASFKNKNLQVDGTRAIENYEKVLGQVE